MLNYQRVLLVLNGMEWVLVRFIMGGNLTGSGASKKYITWYNIIYYNIV
jgi:hypothetical protein